MKRRTFLTSTALAAASLQATLAGAAARRPNVIVILTDDQGYGDFSFSGNPVLRTPNMDRLSAAGVRFTNFHVTPVCTPTRGQLMTGCDALHNLASAVTAGRTMIRRDMPTMAELFRAGGYATGLFGKWHLGHDYPDRPMDRGFDKAVWFRGWGMQSEIEFDNDYVNPRYLDGLTDKRAAKYSTDLWFDEAMAWMQQQAAARRPFFAYIPTNAPHRPLWPPEEYRQLYAGKVEPEVAALYAMIANIDDNLGRLDRWLEARALFDDTIVLFLTDNGGSVGRGVFDAGMRDAKKSHYEGGHRVPCFLRWPGGAFDKGLEISAPTQVQDLLPTLLDLCDIPARNAGFDGTSLVPLVRKQPFGERMLVVQYALRDRPIKYDAAVIWRQWRLQKGVELYDMDADRGQKTDRAAQHPDVVARMRDYYDAWWAKLEPGFSQPVPVLLGTPQQNPVTLTSVDWWEVDLDHMEQVSLGAGGPRGGVWHVDARAAGRYRVELRRWPFHTNMSIGSGGPRKTINGRPLEHPYTVMRARTAVLSADGSEHSAVVTPESTGAIFELMLAQGRHELQGWLRDAEGKDLCGTYYAQVTHVTEKVTG